MICCTASSKINGWHSGRAEARERGEPTVREVTIAFADLDSFTRFTDEHGDVAALSVATRLEDAARGSLVGRTRLIKRVGDAVMLAAPTPGEMVATVLVLREVLGADPAVPPLAVGIHHGSAVIADGDIVGAAVNLAGHLADEADSGEIWCTEPVTHALNGDHGTVAIERGADRLGGLNDLRLYELV